MESDWIGLLDTTLEYYLGFDVSQLTDEQWTAKVAQLAYIRKAEQKKSNEYS